METVVTSNPAQILGLAIADTTGPQWGARAIAVTDETYTGGVKLRVIARSRAGAMCAYDAAARMTGLRVERFEIRIRGHKEIFVHDESGCAVSSSEPAA